MPSELFERSTGGLPTPGLQSTMLRHLKKRKVNSRETSVLRPLIVAEHGRRAGWAGNRKAQRGYCGTGSAASNRSARRPGQDRVTPAGLNTRDAAARRYLSPGLTGPAIVASEALAVPRGTGGVRSSGDPPSAIPVLLNRFASLQLPQRMAD